MINLFHNVGVGAEFISFHTISDFTLFIAWLFYFMGNSLHKFVPKSHLHINNEELTGNWWKYVPYYHSMFNMCRSLTDKQAKIMVYIMWIVACMTS